MRGVSLADRDTNAAWRDRGLYLDARWAPSWPADVIDWPDLGTPADDEDACRAIRQAFLRAREGEHVEVGCLGGLGRTGTVLACMAVLSGCPADDAVAWVRANYSPHAVETAGQERWVADFARIATEEDWVGTDTSHQHRTPPR